MNLSPFNLTVADLLPTLRLCQMMSGALVPAYAADACSAYAHPKQPTVDDLVRLFEQMPQNTKLADLPQLGCGCYDLDGIEALLAPLIKYIGMGYF